MKPYYVVGRDGLEGPYETLDLARSRSRGLAVVETVEAASEPANAFVPVVLGVREVIAEASGPSCVCGDYRCWGRHNTGSPT